MQVEILPPPPINSRKVALLLAVNKIRGSVLKILKRIGQGLSVLFLAGLLFISGTAIWGAVDGNVSFVDKLTIQQEQQIETPDDENNDLELPDDENTETGDENTGDEGTGEETGA